MLNKVSDVKMVFLLRKDSCSWRELRVRTRRDKRNKGKTIESPIRYYT
jgi:hypothetical protein